MLARFTAGARFALALQWHKTLAGGFWFRVSGLGFRVSGCTLLSEEWRGVDGRE